MVNIDQVGRAIYGNVFTLIDVRSPSEYGKGHIPGAHNVPLFTDEQRAIVGTTYTRKSKDEAIDVGMDFVAPRLNEILDACKAVIPSGSQCLVYCWRGGMRSASVCWFINHAGIDAQTLHQGYKAYRRRVLADLEQPWKFIVIGGYTGSGKTEILHELANRGEQVLDLERLCNHRGSAFGALTMPPQPRSEHAMNLVHQALSMMDASKPIYVEDESQHIGSVWLHEPFFKHLRSCPLITLVIPRDQRARFLSRIYGNASIDQLGESFHKIASPLGGERLANAIHALAEGDLEGAANVALDHYDRAYAFGLKKRGTEPLATIEHNTIDIHELATRIQEHGSQAYKS